LLKLWFEISERTVSRYLARLHRRDGAAQQWRTFLRNHRELITGMDFFTVITANFRILYCLFLIRHDRREIIQRNVTEHPTGEWVVQQLREAFPENTNRQYLIFDRDAKFSAEVQFLDSAGIAALRTSYRSPWQNGVAERWVRSFRNELLDHVIVLNELHLRRLARDYLRYYHADRTHDGLDKDTPRLRPPSIKNPGARLASHPRLGGLHHRYSWQKLLEPCETVSWRPTIEPNPEIRSLLMLFPARLLSQHLFRRRPR
jgi:putative transposase